jgi:hypothetical protein
VWGHQPSVAQRDGRAEDALDALVGDVAAGVGEHLLPSQGVVGPQHGSEPFTLIEQAVLAGELERRRFAHGFGVYNAIATAAGSVGALAAAGIGPVRQAWAGAPSEPQFFLLSCPRRSPGWSSLAV